MIDGVFTLLPKLPPPPGLSGIAGGDKRDERLVGHSSRLRGTLPNRDNAKDINNQIIKVPFHLNKVLLYDEIS